MKNAVLDHAQQNLMQSMKNVIGMSIFFLLCGLANAQQAPSKQTSVSHFEDIDFDAIRRLEVNRSPAAKATHTNGKAATPLPAQSVADLKRLYPSLANLDDDSVVDVIRQVYYPDMTNEQIANQIGVKLKPVFIPRTLGPIDRWRYQSCQQDAAKAPTPMGVNTGLRVCREKFNQ